MTQKFKSFIESKISYAGFATCVAFFCLALAWPSFGATKKNLLEENRGDLTQLETYLNSIKNLSAKFTQETSDGGIAEGKFYLARFPNKAGKMRVEYLASPKILIIVNGSVLAYHDIELDEVSHLGTNTTPASFLTRPNFSFDAKDIEITNVKKSSNEISVSLMKKNRKEAGEFTLVFSLKPIEFIRMEVKNDLGQIIKVTFSNADFGSEISAKLFVIQNNDL